MIWEGAAMRALIWVVSVLAVLWGGYWVVGSRAAKTGAEGWLADAGVHYQDLTIAGFPNRFDLTVTGIQFADPAQGIGWHAPFAQVFAMSWKPWHLIAALPGNQTITLSDQSLDLASSRLMGSLQLVPGPDLTLDEVVAEGSDLRLMSDAGWVLAADWVVASTRLDQTRTNSHRLGLAVSGFAPDPGLIAALAVTGLPTQIKDIHLDAFVALSAPLDRHAGQNHPQAIALDLTEARVDWGDLKLFARGGLARDATGFAAGEITLRAEGWRSLPPLLAALGLITPDFAPVLEQGLQVMAEAGGDPTVLTVPLTAKDGQLALGPLPLGPAPYWGAP